MLLTGQSLLALRVVSAGVGVLTVVLLFLATRRLLRSPVAGLAVALAYAVLPVLVANNRWAFPQNLTGAALLASFLLLWCFRENGKLYYGTAGAALAALAALTSFWAFPFLLLVPILVGPRGLRTALGLFALAAGVSVLPLVLRALTVPEWFLPDLRALLSLPRTALAGSVPAATLGGFYRFATRDVVLPLAMVGLAFVRGRALRWSLLATVGILAIPLFHQRPAFEFIFYPALVFTPLLLLGLGAIVARLADSATRGRPMAMVLLLLIGAHLLVQGGRTVYAVSAGSLGRLASRAPFITQASVPDIRAVSGYLNQRTGPEDLVIAPNIVGWTLNANSVDAIWVACYEHRDAFPNLPLRRFLFPLGVDDAAYAVIDTEFPGDYGLCAAYLPDIMSRIRTEDWPVVRTFGRFEIRQRSAAAPTN